jgi:molybdate transport repressor ModE-like protein
MRLIPTVSWRTEGDGQALDPRLLALLAAIAEQGSLTRACDAAKLPYRSAWGLLRDAAQRLGAPLVALERGRGADLTAAGEALLRADAAARRRLGNAGMSVVPASTTLRQPPLRIAASHDLALAQLRDALPASGALRLDLAFMGSLEALAAFGRGQAELAGFHIPADGIDPTTRVVFRRVLKAARDRLVGFAQREQGLILPPGNPRRVRTFADVAAKKLRFVNRQSGSGTRVLVDALVARAGLSPEGIAGYENAERNHVAVAAAVAAGHADAGFGLRAAAAEFGLAFVPLARERYLFAVRADALEQPAVRGFIELLRGPLARRALRVLPGYAPRDNGAVLTIDSVDT